jgi:hypothetical protein
MRVLLDNNIDHRFRHALVGHDVFPVRNEGMTDFKDGPLLGAIDGKFDVLVTMD